MSKTFLIMVLVAVSLMANATSPICELKKLPPFERAVLIIKFYETLHDASQWPVIGYGHIIQPGEHFTKGAQLTERQADALLRQDLRKQCALYRSYGADSLLLGCLSYNCGPAKVLGGYGYQRSRLMKMLDSGNRNVRKEYLSFCHYQGKVHNGLLRRRWVEYTLLYKE